MCLTHYFRSPLINHERQTPIIFVDIFSMDKFYCLKVNFDLKDNYTKFDSIVQSLISASIQDILDDVTRGPIQHLQPNPPKNEKEMI